MKIFHWLVLLAWPIMTGIGLETSFAVISNQIAAARGGSIARGLGSAATTSWGVPMTALNFWSGKRGECGKGWLRTTGSGVDLIHRFESFVFFLFNLMLLLLLLFAEGGLGMLPKTIGQLFVGGLDVPFGTMKVNKVRVKYKSVFRVQWAATLPRT